MLKSCLDKNKVNILIFFIEEPNHFFKDKYSANGKISQNLLEIS